MRAGERLRMLMAGRQAALAHGSAVAESGFHRSTRRRMHFVAPSRNYEASHAGEWNCSIPEDAPIWVACRKGPTRVWKVAALGAAGESGIVNRESCAPDGATEEA